MTMTLHQFANRPT